MWQLVLDHDLGVIEVLDTPEGDEYRIRFIDGRTTPITAQRCTRICASPRWRMRELFMFEAMGSVAVRASFDNSVAL